MASSADGSQDLDELARIALAILFEKPDMPGQGYTYSGHVFARHRTQLNAWAVSREDGTFVDVFYPSRFRSLGEIERYIEDIVESDRELAGVGRELADPEPDGRGVY